MCFSAGPSEVNYQPGCDADGNFYHLAQAANVEVNNNGGYSIFYNNSRNTHSVDTSVVNLQTCWNHINQSVVAINDNAGSTIDDIKIFPNPATDVINVLFTNVQNVQEITIINVVGEVIYTDKTVISKTNTIDMSSQTEGIYFVKVKTGNQLTTEKIILTK